GCGRQWVARASLVRTPRRPMGGAQCPGDGGLSGRHLGPRLCRTAEGGGRDAGWRALPDTGRGRWSRCDGGGLEGDEGRLLSNAVVAGKCHGSAAATAAEVPGSAGRGTAGGDDERPPLGGAVGEVARVAGPAAAVAEEEAEQPAAAARAGAAGG